MSFTVVHGWEEKKEGGLVWNELYCTWVGGWVGGRRRTDVFDVCAFPEDVRVRLVDAEDELWRRWVGGWIVWL